MNIGFPEASVSFNRGQDLLYRQFNDIDVYVEDTGKERLYFQLFKTLLPGITVSKIFPLNGKENVIKESQANCNNKRKVYLVDLDFDHVLGRKQSIRNLIYLERYSIENYLLDEDAIKEQIREKKPSISDAEILSRFNYSVEVSSVTNYLRKLALVALVNQRYSLGVSYPSIESYDYINFNNTGVYSIAISSFFTRVESALKSMDGRFTLAARIKVENAIIKGMCPSDLIPGKWILTLIKDILIRRKLIFQKPNDSFSYALAKDVNIHNIGFIAREISRIRS